MRTKNKTGLLFLLFSCVLSLVIFPMWMGFYGTPQYAGYFLLFSIAFFVVGQKLSTKLETKSKTLSIISLFFWGCYLIRFSYQAIQDFRYYHRSIWESLKYEFVQPWIEIFQTPFMIVVTFLSLATVLLGVIPLIQKTKAESNPPVVLPVASFILAFTLCLLSMMNVISLFQVDLKKTYKHDWALYNYGQKIDGQKGIKGIDTNFGSSVQRIHNLFVQYMSVPVTVAVVDTGVIHSRQYANRYWKNLDKNNSNDLWGWNFYDNNPDTTGTPLHDYHGTYIANKILQLTQNTQIMAVKFLRGTEGTAKNATKAVDYAISHGAKVINCSWSFNKYDKELYALIKDHPDVLFVCAAGNSKINLDETPSYPSSYSLGNILTVMAMDHRGELYEASGYGKQSVHIAAPGKHVKVLFPNDEEAFVDGTSIATAFVSAAAATMFSLKPLATPEDVIDSMMQRSTKLPSLETLCASGGYLSMGRISFDVD